MKIFVITHKDYTFPNNNIYSPLLVGAEKNEIKMDCFKDNTGDNISSKNKNYCELTGLYWIWKNVNCDIVGLCHYRRYFFKYKYTKSLNNVLTNNDISKILSKYDVIVPQKKYLIDGSIYDDYANHHNIKDFDKCIEIINLKYPEYSDSIKNVIKKKYLYPYNMFIMKKELLNNYCEWLFSILFELEHEIKIDSYDKYNQRIYGFLSERLFNIWLYHNNISLLVKTVNNVEEITILEKIKNVFKHLISYISKNKCIKKIISNHRKKKVM